MTTVDQKIAHFKNDCSAQGLSAETCTEYAAVLREFLKINNNPEIVYENSYTDIKKYLEAYRLHLLRQDLSYSRVKYKFTAINNWFRLLLDDGLISTNPIPEYRKRYIRTFKKDRPPERQLIT